MGSQLSLSKVARLLLKGRSARQQELESTQLTSPLLADRAAYVIDVGRLVHVYGQPSSDAGGQAAVDGPSADFHSGDAATGARFVQIEQRLLQAQRELEWMREKVALKDQVIAGLEAQIKLLSGAQGHEPTFSDTDASRAPAADAYASGTDMLHSDASGRAEAALPVRRPALFSQLDAAGWAEHDGLHSETAHTATAWSESIGGKPERERDLVLSDESSDFRLDDVHRFESDTTAMQLTPESQDEPPAACSDALSSEEPVDLASGPVALDDDSMDELAEPAEPALDQMALHELDPDELDSDELDSDELAWDEQASDESDLDPLASDQLASDEPVLDRRVSDEPESDHPVPDAPMLDAPFVAELAPHESVEAVGSDPSKLLFELPRDLLDLPAADSEAAETELDSVQVATVHTRDDEAETQGHIPGLLGTAEPDAASVPAGFPVIEEQDWSLPDFSSSSEADWPTASEPAVEAPIATEHVVEEPVGAEPPVQSVPVVESLQAESADRVSGETALPDESFRDGQPASSEDPVLEPAGLDVPNIGVPSRDPTPAGLQASKAETDSRSEWDVLETELDTLKQMMDPKADAAQGSDAARITAERSGQKDPFEFDLDIPELTLDMRILPGASALAAPAGIDEPVGTGTDAVGAPEPIRTDAETDISELAQRKLARAQAMARMSADPRQESALAGSSSPIVNRASTDSSASIEAAAPADGPAPDKEVQDYLAESRQRRWALWRNKNK